MSAINKELYDALIEGSISEEKAAKASRSVMNEKINDKQQDRLSSFGQRLGAIETRLAVVETKLDTVTRLSWVLVAGVAGTLIKTLLT